MNTDVPEVSTLPTPQTPVTHPDAPDFDVAQAERKERKKPRKKKHSSSKKKKGATSSGDDEILAQPTEPNTKLPITVSILQAKNIVLAKDDITTTVKIQFGTETFESEPLKGSAVVLSKVFQRSLADDLINNVLNDLIRVTLYEVQNNIKNALGSITISLEELLENNVIRNWYPLESESEHRKQTGELEISVSVPDPLLQKDEYENSSVLTIRVFSAHSIPENWTPKKDDDTNLFTYNVAIKGLPQSAVNMAESATHESSEPTLVPQSSQLRIHEEFKFSNGTVLQAPKPDSEPIPESISMLGEELFWKWNEDKKPRVTWNSYRKVFLSKDIIERWKQAILAGVLINLEMWRGLKPQYEATTDLNAYKYRGKAAIDLKPFLEPGQTSLPTTRYNIYNYPPLVKESTEKKNKKPVENSPDKTRNSSRQLSKKKKPKEDPLTLLQSETEVDNPFEASKTYIIVQVTLSNPLTAKLPTPRSILKVADFIHSRAPLPHYFQLKEASQEFQDEIKQVALNLAAEYKKLFPAKQGNLTNIPGGIGLTSIDKRRKVVQELSNSGKYFIFKETLKKSIVRIVKENGFDSKGDMEMFISELHSYLVEQMHHATNELVAQKTTPAKRPEKITFVPDMKSMDTLKRFANEAEIMGNFNLATKYYLERITQSGEDSNLWFEYAEFALRIKQVARAEECLLEAITHDPKHFNSLLMYGSILTQKGEYQKAEAFLRGAVEQSPESPLAHGILALMYSLFQQENELQVELTIAEGLYQKEDPANSMYIKIASYLLEKHITHLAEIALFKDMDNINALLLFSKLHLQKGDYQEAAHSTQEYQKLDPNNDEAWALLGDIEFARHAYKEAASAYEQAYQLFAEKQVVKIYILLRLGDLYIRIGRYASAKDIYLETCRMSASAYTWLGVGVACYRSGEFMEAQDAFAEANIQNPLDPLVWGWVAMLCLRTYKEDVAERALREAFKLELKDFNLLLDIGENYLLHNRFTIAEECFTRALEIEPTNSHAQRLLADALYEQNSYQRAYDLYAKVQTTGNSSDRTHAYQQGLVISHLL